MEKRITKKDNFMRLIELVEGANVENRNDLVDFLNHEIELLNKKKASGAKTKTQKENEVLIETLYNALVEIGRPVTITELQGEKAEIGTLSNQKISALMKKLVDTNRVNKSIDKKKSYFSVGE